MSVDFSFLLVLVDVTRSHDLLHGVTALFCGREVDGYRVLRTGDADNKLCIWKKQQHKDDSKINFLDVLLYMTCTFEHVHLNMS